MSSWGFMAFVLASINAVINISNNINNNNNNNNHNNNDNNNNQVEAIYFLPKQVYSFKDIDLW